MSATTPCRFATSPLHQCSNRDGRTPPRPDTTCWHEAAAQVDEQGAVLREAEGVVAALPHLDRIEAREAADHDGEAEQAHRDAFVGGGAA